MKCRTAGWVALALFGVPLLPSAAAEASRVAVDTAKTAGAPPTQDFLRRRPRARPGSSSGTTNSTATKLDAAKWDTGPRANARAGGGVPRRSAWTARATWSCKTYKEGDRYVDGCVTTQGKFEHSLRLLRGPRADAEAARPLVGVLDHGSAASARWATRAGTAREIDIMEKPWLDERVQHTFHWDGYGKEHKSEGKVAKVPGVMDGIPRLRPAGGQPDEYVFYVDGKETWRTKAGGVCQVPEYILLSDEIGNWAGDIAKAKLPDQFLVDYVRVYDLVEKR